MRRRAPLSTGICRGLTAALVALAAAPAWAQRVQFPSMVAGDSVYAPQPPAVAPGGAVAVQPGASVYAPAGDPYAPPTGYNMPPPAWDQYADPTGPPPALPYAPGPADPYAAGPPALYPEGMPTMFPEGGMFATLAKPIRFMQEIRGQYTWLAGDSSPDSFDVNDVELSATFAIPITFNQAPLLVTPGFAFHFWEGPVSPPADLPPRAYDAFLDFGWRPQIKSWLAADLGVRTGVYSDFAFFDSESIRVLGRALAVVTVTPNVQVAAGIVYLDRLKVKLLPAGGIIWTPHPDARYEILFPNPKLARRFTTVGTTDIWGYIAAEYGGGSWTVQRTSGAEDQIDYNDIRVMLGLEAVGQGGFRGHFEFGYVFQREILYRSDMPDKFEPGDTLMVRAGLAY